MSKRERNRRPIIDYTRLSPLVDAWMQTYLDEHPGATYRQVWEAAYNDSPYRNAANSEDFMFWAASVFTGRGLPFSKWDRV